MNLYTLAHIYIYRRRTTKEQGKHKGQKERKRREKRD